MHTLRLLRYFIYLATNWNVNIAWHILMAEIRGEKKYGIDTTGADELKSLSDKGIDTTHATIYMPASYDLLETIFKQLQSVPISHLIDFGCGKGRVLCVAAYYDIPKVTGMDISKEFCEEAKVNLARVHTNKPQLLSRIINNDAFYYEIPDDADCLFFFNPFDEILMSGVVKNIVESLVREPREMRIIYFNPLHKKLLTEHGFKETFHVKKLKYLEACILLWENKKPDSIAESGL